MFKELSTRTKRLEDALAEAHGNICRLHDEIDSVVKAVSYDPLKMAFILPKTDLLSTIPGGRVLEKMQKRLAKEADIEEVGDGRKP
jgi:hypothetical protein